MMLFPKLGSMANLFELTDMYQIRALASHGQQAMRVLEL